MNILIDNLNISYKITGTGEDTLVILQGWGTSMKVYDSITAQLCQRFRVVQFDFPGFGSSTEPPAAWSVSDYTDFFRKLMLFLDVKHAYLLGHSYGGRVIIKLAGADHPDFKIDGILLVDSAGIVHEKTNAQKFKIKKYKFLKKIVESSVFSSLAPELTEEWKSKQGSADYRNATPVMRQCLVKAVNEDLRDLLPRIQQETLLIWGENDTATPYSDAELMDSLLPNSGLCKIANAGHYCFLDQPGVFSAILRSYFKL